VRPYIGIEVITWEMIESHDYVKNSFRFFPADPRANACLVSSTSVRLGAKRYSTSAGTQGFQISEVNDKADCWYLQACRKASQTQSGLRDKLVVINPVSVGWCGSRAEPERRAHC
jgi:hypothetical protein